MKRVFVSYPFARDPDKSQRVCKEMSRVLIELGFCPVSPQLFLPLLVDEAKERGLAINLCTSYLLSCDHLLVVGKDITSGMASEIKEATTAGIPIFYLKEWVDDDDLRNNLLKHIYY